jgi:predicted DNA binding protein
MHYISITQCDPKVIPSIRRRLREIMASDKDSVTGDKLLPEQGLTTTPALILRCFSRRNSIARIFDRNTAVPLYPIVYRVGWEYYRTLILDHTRSPHLIREFSERGKVEVISKASARGDQPGESIAIQLDELTASMTDLQVEAVVRSVTGGYFDVPRKASLREIAGGTGVPRRTFGEHLQKAEGKLLRSLTPYLALISNPDRSSASEPG